MAKTLPLRGRVVGARAWKKGRPRPMRKKAGMTSVAATPPLLVILRIRMIVCSRLPAAGPAARKRNVTK